MTDATAKGKTKRDAAAKKKNEKDKATKSGNLEGNKTMTPKKGKVSDVESLRDIFPNDSVTDSIGNAYTLNDMTNLIQDSLTVSLVSAYETTTGFGSLDTKNKNKVMSPPKSQVLKSQVPVPVEMVYNSRQGTTKLFSRPFDVPFTSLGDFRPTKGFAFLRYPRAAFLPDDGITDSADRNFIQITTKKNTGIAIIVLDTSQENIYESVLVKEWVKRGDKFEEIIDDGDLSVCRSGEITDDQIISTGTSSMENSAYLEPSIVATYPADDVCTFSLESLSPVVSCRCIQIPPLRKLWISTATASRLFFVTLPFNDINMSRMMSTILVGESNPLDDILGDHKKRMNFNDMDMNTDHRNDFDDQRALCLSAFSFVIPEGGLSTDPNALVISGFTLNAPRQALLLDADLKLSMGKRYGLIGPNGKGKTTLLKHLAYGIEISVWDVLLVEQEARSSDRTVVEEVLSVDIVTARLLKREKEIMDFLSIEDEEDVGNQKEKLDILQLLKELEEVSTELGLREAEKKDACVRKILAGLGFSAIAQESPINQFSGGWRMRVSLAKALFMEPKLLLLDEPTNHLDLDAVVWLDEYISAQYPYTVVVVSHDVDFLDAVCTDIICLDAVQKKLLQYKGGYTEFKKMRNQQLRQQEKKWDIHQKKLKSCKNKPAREALVKSAEKDGISRPVEYNVKFVLKGRGGDSSIGRLGLSEVSFSYRGTAPYILREVDFSVDCESRICLVGANGSGKSTLLKLLVGQLKPCTGEVIRSPGLRVEFFSQHFEDHLDVSLTPVEFLRVLYHSQKQDNNIFAARKSTKDTDDDNFTAEKARKLLGSYGLDSGSHLKILGTLSGGQKARVAFAALGIRNPHIVVLDEPTNHLDVETVEALTQSLEQFQGGIVLVTHDARLVNSLSCDIWRCIDTRVHRIDGGFDGYRNDVMESMKMREKLIEQKLEGDRKAREERIRYELQKRRNCTREVNDDLCRRTSDVSNENQAPMVNSLHVSTGERTKRDLMSVMNSLNSSKAQ